MQITDKFDGCIEAICDSRLIIVDRAFSNLLRTLAATPEYLHVVREAASTTSFASELQKCTETGEFKLPKSNKSAVALTVGLLLEFDKRKISVTDFVTKYFPDSTSNGCFQKFIDTVIKPFARAFRSLITGENAIVGEPDNISAAVITEQAKEELENWLKNLLANVYATDSLDEDGRRDLTDIIKGMLYVTEFDNPILMKVSFLGLSYALGYYNFGSRELNAVKQILTTYGILE